MFLHDNLIAHRVRIFLDTQVALINTYSLQDIRPPNMLVNRVIGNDLTDIREFLDSGQAIFVLCDFGLSCKFSVETHPAQRVRPCEECNFSTFGYQPPDGTNGEAFYDPFAFDVACLGGVFCELIGVWRYAHLKDYYF